VPLLLLLAGVAAAAFPVYVILFADDGSTTEVLDASAFAPTSTSAAEAAPSSSVTTTAETTTTLPPLPDLVPCEGNLVMIGDSLTSFSTGSLELVRALLANGCSYDLVGSSTDGYGGRHPLGRPMIAQPGFNSCGIDAVLGQQIATLAADPPDLAILRVGLNNFSAPGAEDSRNPDVSDEPLAAYDRCVTRMISRLREVNPNVSVVLAKPHNDLAFELDTAVNRVAREISTDESPVLVTGRIARVETPGSLEDGGDIVHPTAEGAAWLGARESADLLPYLAD
jgi:hypothetical protein